VATREEKQAYVDGKANIASHIRFTLDHGLSNEEILEAMEIAIPESGIVAFQAGFEA
jgi:4-carboxymuconolactone decarboxylase